MMRTVVMRTISLVVLFLILVNPAIANIPHNEYKNLKEGFLSLFREMESVREPTFWEAHKWKIIIGAGVIVGGVAIVASGGAATPAVTGAAAITVPLMKMAVGSVAVTSLSATTVIVTGVIAGAAGAAVVIVGAKVTKKLLDDHGVQAFLNSSSFEYMAQNSLVLGIDLKTAVYKALKEHESYIISSSKTPKDVFRHIDAVMLGVLKKF